MKTRNIGIIAHIDAGKTTTTERILFYTGKSHRIGDVDDGTAAMDWMPQEQNRGITITAASTTTYWKDHQINIIDTPGHVDFTAEVERSLRVLDATIAIFCAVGGVEPQSETVWRQAEENNIPCIAYINKMDRAGADFFSVIQEIQTKLHVVPLVLSIPIGKENDFSGTIDLLTMKELHWNTEDEGTTCTQHSIREELTPIAEKWKERLIDNLSHYSDSIMELAINAQEIPMELIQENIRTATLSRAAVPVFAGASLRNIGVQPLLDAVTEYFPNPDEIPPIQGYTKNGEQSITISYTQSSSMLALVFKVHEHREMGRLSYVRVYCGTLKPASTVRNYTQGKTERIHRLLRMHANRSEIIEKVKAGDIAVIVGLKHTKTGDTIGSDKTPIFLENIIFPDPVITAALEPRALSERKELIQVLQSIAIEDPTFQWKDDNETGQLIISGMGELHLEVIIARITDEYHLPVRVGKPQVTYRESITETREHREVFTKLIGGKEHYAEIVLRVSPLKRGAGNRFENLVSTNILPPAYGQACEHAVMGSLSAGIQFGYSVIDIEAVLVEAVFHEDTASEFAFEACTSLCFDNACAAAGPILLEPVMRISVFAPAQYLGEAIQSITMRGGIIHSIESRTSIEHISAEAALHTMFGYSTSLRSITQGRGTYTMEFSHYAPKQTRELDTSL